MIEMLDPAPALHVPGSVQLRDTRREILELMLLREAEDHGPLTGRQALDAIAALSCSLTLDPAAYSLIHDLRDAGLLAASTDRPPRYAITPSGRSEAERLATQCWPSIRDLLTRFNVCIACLAPRIGSWPPR